MQALLAEHSTAAVRNLSAGVSTPASGWGKAGQKTEEDAGGLARRLMATLGRPLDAQETKFIRKLHTVFQRCQQNRRITYWDFEELGLRLGGYGWDALKIWPAFPADEYEFWLYVANSAAEQALKIPPFMEAITDLRPIQERLIRWHRAREIDKWKQTLGNLRADAVSPSLTSCGPTDLRLILGEQEAFLERQQPGQDSFQVMKASELRRLEEEINEGLVQLTNEAEVLWHLFSLDFYSGSTQMHYEDVDACDALRRILRLPLLESRILTLNRQKLARPAEPLRWELSAAASEQDDYRLRLVRADGSAPPPILCTMEGNPTLYLTADALFTGPRPHENVLDPAKESRIPAPAIESPAGLTFLLSLGLELPERMRERVQRLSFQVVIDCRLQPIYSGSSTVGCQIC